MPPHGQQSPIGLAQGVLQCAIANVTSVEEQVLRTTRALGPFIIPMINRLGALSAEEVATFGQTGDDE